MSWIYWLCIALFINHPSIAIDSEVIEAIQKEATRGDHDSQGRPLPLASHWRARLPSEQAVRGFGPREQLQLLEAGHHIIPWIPQPEVGSGAPLTDYYEPLIKACAHYKLPMVFLGTQWERLLSTEPKYFELPPSSNPNVIRIDGTVEKKVSPFGNVGPWREAGRSWGSHPAFRQFQHWYPDPPLVIFLSNNEHPKLRWHDVENCKAYMDRFGFGKSDELKRTFVAEGWKIRYGALIGGFREALVATAWRRNAVFIGYNAFASPSMGRWPGWREHSLHYRDRLSVWPEIWNGCSLPFYTHPWDASCDFRVWSPQIESMNWVAAHTLLPRDRPFWIELSTWDGHEPIKANDKRLWYEAQGQQYSPKRYAGMVQYGMWLLRPRSVREFRPHVESIESMEPYFSEVLAAVDRVHRNPTLRAFWRRGNLVANDNRSHPYDEQLPSTLANTPRWFRLDTDLDPIGTWKLDTELDVFALALEIGKPPLRRWLVYAHAPKGTHHNVKVMIRQDRAITVDVPLEGGFWVVDEAGGEFHRID